MPFSLTCPNPSCSAKLKTPTAIPFGRKVQCPKCKNPFTVDATNLVEIPADPASASTATNIRPVSASAPPTQKRQSESVPAKAETKKRPPDDEEESPRSRRRIEDDDEKPVRAKRRDDDEEEEPRSRGRARDDEENEAPRPSRGAARTEDDEEAPRSQRRGKRDEENDEAGEETPRSRRRSVDDEEESPRAKRSKSRVEEEDEAPRSRRRARDDDDDDDDSPRSRRRSQGDEDEAPRSRRRGRDDDEVEDDQDDEDYDRPRRRKKKSGNTAKLIAMIGGGALLLGGLIFLFIYLFSGGGYDKKMMAYMPANTTLIIGVNVEDIMAIDELKAKFEEGFKNTGGAALKSSGIEPNDISKVYVGFTKLDFGNNPPMVTVVRFKKEPDKKKFSESLKAKEEKHKETTYYKGPEMMYFFPSDDLAVGSNNEETLKKLIEKDNNDIVISDDLKLLVDKAGGGTIWGAGVADVKSLPPQANFVMGMAAAGAGSEIADAVKTAKGFAAWAKIGSSSADIGISVLCKDGETATKAADAMSKKLEEIRKEASKESTKNDKEAAAKDALDSLSVGSSGSMLKGSVSVNFKPFLKEMGGRNPFAFP